MGKSFFDVFPGLTLEGHTKEIMEQTEVVKVSTTRKQDFIRIYIASNNLIDKSDIYKTESSIKRQLFKGVDVTIKIYEKFALSAQYTVKNLLDLYRESIEMELRDYDHMEYSLFRAADFLYPDEGNVVVRLEDSVVGQKKAPDLMRVLDKIINERCGLSVVISPEFVKVDREKKEPDYMAETAKMAQKLEKLEHQDDLKKAGKSAPAASSGSPNSDAGKAPAEKSADSGA
ncbi:MAG: PolC-type DNA polymerase III, partial [Lachnospiraceae bacterium]|nr:PolC-type DNA polymerase III [Lachnospiraceae bacterium]